jgi:hypothetical protein
MLNEVPFLQILKKKSSLLIFLASTLLLLHIAIKPAYAEVIDRIQINQAGDEAEIRIQFVTRVQYLRQVMLKNGDVRIYFNLLEIDATDPRLTWQKRDSPPSNIVPKFTLTYPEIDSSLSISFGKAVEYHIRPGNDGRSISFFTPINSRTQANTPLIAPGAIPPPASTPPRNPAEVELTEVEAKLLMENATVALKKSSNQAAVTALKNILNLPLNQQTQAAQLMIGQAYEQNGEFSKARTEYDSYIKLYPKAKNLNQVKESLARVFMAAYESEKSVPERMAIDDKMNFFGGFSQYYYKGILHSDSMTPPSAVVTSSNISDQSQLISALELTGLKRTQTTETRIVFRDTFAANFLPGIGSNNFLDAAYLEQTPNDQSYFYGLGRRTGMAGGVPSRFDGAWLSRNINDSWRVHGTLGTPVQAYGSTGEAKVFAAISVDLTRLPGQWSGNTYLIEQRVGETLDRRAAGMEAHYFDSKSNHTGLMEYDTLFKRFNFGLFQGNWMTTEDKNYTLLIEHRRLPSLQITNALLLEQPNQSIAGLIQSGVTTNTLRDNALRASPLFNQFTIGMTQPYSPHLKLGGDIKVSNTTSYEAYDSVQNIPVSIPRVQAYIYSIQMVGNNLLFDNDLGIASASYTNASTYQSRLLAFSQTETFSQNWRLDIALLLYAENNSLIGDTTRISPSFKLNYHWNASQTFEFGAGFEQTHTQSTILDSKSRRKFFNIGYRWDFQ